MTALRYSVFLQREAIPQVVSVAKDNGRIYGSVCGFCRNTLGFVQSEERIELRTDYVLVLAA